MSTRDFSWGKGGRCVWLTTYHPCTAETSRKSGALTYPEPLGPPRPVAGDLYLYSYDISLNSSENEVYFRKKVIQKNRNTHFVFHNSFFLPKVVPFMGWFRKKMVGPDKPQMAKNNAAHQNCMLDKYGYKHTLRISTTMYRVSQEECARLREGVPYVKVCNPGPPTCYIRTIHHIAVTTVLCSWRLANYCPKHVELIRRSIKLLIVASSWSFILFTYSSENLVCVLLVPYGSFSLNRLPW